ncbi:hypothetical protein PSZ99_23760, partial [Shigella sonnei]|nr:hypothetical protein [Shigella sonnei]
FSFSWLSSSLVLLLPAELAHHPISVLAKLAQYDSTLRSGLSYYPWSKSCPWHDNPSLYVRAPHIQNIWARSDFQK